MTKWSLACAGLAILAASVAPGKSTAQEQVCIVTDPTGTPLNVRSSPNGAIRRTVSNGASVVIRGSSSLNGKPWALVATASGQELGWVFRSFVTCRRKPEPVMAAPEPKREVAPAKAVAARPVAPSPAPAPAVAPIPVAVAAPPVVAPAPRAAPRDPEPALPGARAEKRVALVIGNSGYRHAPPLRNPANDAADVAAALKALGFDVVEGRDLDFQATRTAVRSFSQKLAGADVALFFYAGHGVQVAGKNYLVPIDAKLDAVGDLDIDAIAVEAVQRSMEAEQRSNILMLDACRDNPFARSLRRSLGSSRSAAVGEGLAAIKTAGGTLVVYATEPDNVALDGDGARNSPFTGALLRHIATPELEVEAMLKRVRGEVIQATRGKQTPWNNSSLVKDVYLAPGRK